MFNANNYGYNPYGTYMPQRPTQQQMTQIQPQEQMQQSTSQMNRTMLNGKQVDSIDVVKAMDIPLDGSVSYFPIVDGSAIVSKQLQMDGTSKMVIYKPIEGQKEEIKYITQEDMKKAIDNIDLSDLDDIKDELKELKQEIKDLKKKKVKDE